MKRIKEIFAKLLEEPDRVKLREFLESNFGELNSIDFKKDWVEFDKLARHILAMANSGGGIIIIGVEENEGEINPVGVKIVDKAKIGDKLNKFLPDNLEFEIGDFIYKESEYSKIQGKSFQIVRISDKVKYIPFFPKKDSTTLKKTNIYIRRDTKSTEANYEELQRILNRRIESEYSSNSEMKLEEHLSQLKVLYNQIIKYYSIDPFVEMFEDKMFQQLPMNRQELNPNYPKEEYEEFIIKLIEIKKTIIESTIKK